MNHFYKRLETQDQTLALAQTLATVIREGAILFLDGPLGVGKTTFVRGFLRSLGYMDKVKSPTYTLVEPYEINGQSFYHFDLFRLEDPKELNQIGIQDYFDANSICFIEWPEKGLGLLPEPDLICQFQFDEPGRTITIKSQSHKGKNILSQLKTMTY